MEDEELDPINFCSDLVSLRKFEAFPQALLGARPGGEWAGVDELCQRSGLPASSANPHLFATWLPDPLGNEAYVVVLFYDDESKWSMAANYNRQRLESGTALNQTRDQAGAKKTMLAKQVLQEINSGGRVSKKTQLALDDAARMASDQ